MYGVVDTTGGYTTGCSAVSLECSSSPPVVVVSE